jgi:hypothetical protein
MAASQYYYGKVYLNDKLFESHLKYLNIKVTRGELETYEEQKLLYPLKKIVKPIAYVKYFFDIKHNPRNKYHNKSIYEYPDKWEKLHNLLYEIDNALPSSFSEKYEENLHPLDKIKFKSRYLIVPDISFNYKPWITFRVEAGKLGDNNISESRLINYYGYWQAYQVEAIQHWKIYFEYRSILKYIPDKERDFYLRFKRSPKYLGDFLGINRCFELLSHFIHIYSNLRNDFFYDRKSDVLRYFNLSSFESKIFDDKLSDIANNLFFKKYQLHYNDLEEFLKFLIQLYYEYDRNEKYKLSKMVKSDISYLLFFWQLITKQTRDSLISDLYQKQTQHRRTLLNIFKDDWISQKEDVYLHLQVIFPKFFNKQTKYMCPKDANKLIDDFIVFCESTNLPTILEVILRTDRVYNSSGDLRELSLYQIIQTMCSCLEAVSKHIANNSKDIKIRRFFSKPYKPKTLEAILKHIFSKERWMQNINSENLWKLVSFNEASHITDYKNNLKSIFTYNKMKDSDNNFFLQIILTSCLTRNFTHHHLYSARKIFHDNYFEVWNYLLWSIIFVWLHSKENDLI